MMKKNHRLRKALLLLCSVALLVGMSVGATVAYLTSTTNVVKNTFTVGKVSITLDEAKTDEYGVANSGADRVTENKYKLVPGRTYTKDPTIHVDANSEECYLFVKVENGITDIEADTNETAGTSTIADQMKEEGWTPIAEGSNIYSYKETVKSSDIAQDIQVFGKFTVNSAKTADNLKSYEDKTITITAYAIQAYGFNTAGAAWEAADF